MLFYLLTRQYPVEGADVRGAPRGACVRHDAGRCSTFVPICPSRSPASSKPRSSAAPDKRFASTGQMIAALSEAIGVGIRQRRSGCRS